MRQDLRRAIPSMFHRRLLLIGLAAAVMGLALTAQTLRLASGGSQQEKLDQLEAQLLRTRYIPTIRGAIRDRHGRLLAHDAPGYDVAVHYSILSGTWAFDRAVEAARREAGEAWSTMTDAERFEASDAHEIRLMADVEAMFDELCAITERPREELDQRAERTRRRVRMSKAQLWEAWRRREENRRGQFVAVGEVAQPLAESRDDHVLITDVSGDALDVIRRRVAKADQSSDPSISAHRNPDPWSRLEVMRPRTRLYPVSAQRVTIDTSSFPSFAQGPPGNESIDVDVMGVGLHLVGHLRATIGEDVKARPFHGPDGAVDLVGYGDRNDRIGAAGAEAAAESLLRGARGQTVTHLDTGEIEETRTVPGRDVSLTIDAVLQARVEALIAPASGLTRIRPWYETDMVERGATGLPLNGAAIVLDIASGEVLAAASAPTPSRQDLLDHPAELFRDFVDFPMIHRPTGRPLPPGSVVKPLVLAMAATAGERDEHDHANCTGFLDLNQDGEKGNHEPGCWIHARGGSHGEVDGQRAIMHSCNIYFYELGLEIGGGPLCDWYRMLGFGRKPGTGLPGERGGSLPTPRQAASMPRIQAALMSIGQGPIDATPLQIANAYAAIARGGIYRPPVIVTDRRVDESQIVDLGLSRDAIALAIAGMSDVVNDPAGSAYQLRTGSGQNASRETLWNTPGIEIVGKSGTAQASPQLEAIDDDGDGYRDRWGAVLRSGNHGWFVTLSRGAGDAAWRYVTVVVMEHGGGGGMTAAPIVNQIHHALQDLGYLPTPPASDLPVADFSNTHVPGEGHNHHGDDDTAVARDERPD